jgi:hypothetical protein
MNDEPRDEELRRIERRLSQASDAAERLIAEAARTTRRDSPPPAGWEAPPAEESRSGRRAAELELLISGLRLVSELVPPEALERLAAALRELLLALRALIDFYIDRLERPRPERGGVRDIPIE